MRPLSPPVSPSAPLEKVNLLEKFALFDDQWSPKQVGAVGDMSVKVAKVFGEFVWHSHEAEDELFFVVRGTLRLRFRDHEVMLDEGEFLVVPRGVEHLPVADEECWILLIEPASTINTGTAGGVRTVKQIEKI